MNSFQDRIDHAGQTISEAEIILIGGGAGLSAAAGLEYSGKRFTDHFADFIVKYGIEDMYSASFYPFETHEEFWAQWARHIDVNRFSQGPTLLYQMLFQLVQDKDYFVITTNVESQFEKAGFPSEKIYEVQGNYGFLQCAKGCHDQLYGNEQLIKQMLIDTQDCRIPSGLVPKCPVCGGPMDVNLRHDEFFVQNEAWYQSQARYQSFLKRTENVRIVFIELGVGYNTSGIIRFPFERMTYHNANATLIRLNRDHPMGAKENIKRTISFDEEMSQVVKGLLKDEHARYLEPLARLHQV